MADLGLPCSPWACYEAWQNNSDRWWQMSLRARLGVGAHANKTNETLCVSFSRCRQSAQACTQSYNIHTQACAKRNARGPIEMLTNLTPANHHTNIPFKRWHLNPPIFRCFQAPLTHILPCWGKNPWPQDVFPFFSRLLSSSVLIEKANFIELVMCAWLVLIEFNFNLKW